MEILNIHENGEQYNYSPYPLPSFNIIDIWPIFINTNLPFLQVNNFKANPRHHIILPINASIHNARDKNTFLT